MTARPDRAAVSSVTYHDAVVWNAPLEYHCVNAKGYPVPHGFTSNDFCVCTQKKTFPQYRPWITFRVPAGIDRNALTNHQKIMIIRISKDGPYRVSQKKNDPEDGIYRK